MTKIETEDTIWKFHINASDAHLFIECKTEQNEFYLWDPIPNKRWHFPKLSQYVYSIVQVQLPYTLISYHHQDNLLKPSILMCYNLVEEKEVWVKSDIVLLACYDGVLEVYNSKIEPKQKEYINFTGEKTNAENLIESKLDVSHAQKEAELHSISYNDKEYQFEHRQEGDCIFRIKQGEETIYENTLNIDDYNSEYDYLLRIGSRIVLLLDKHSLMLF